MNRFIQHKTVKWLGVVSLAFMLVTEVFSQPVWAKVAPITHFAHLSIPILGVTWIPSKRPVGIVSSVVVDFRIRPDQKGLNLRFQNMPGKFSPFAQYAVRLGIERAAAAAHLSTLSWTVALTFPYRGLTLYGKSLSAMVGLSVVALAKGDKLLDGRALTGTITKDGHIGTVGGVPEKISAAYRRHFNRVFIPEAHYVGDDDWTTPFLMQVSPVNTVENAYLGLTGHPLLASSSTKP